LNRTRKKRRKRSRKSRGVISEHKFIFHVKSVHKRVDSANRKILY
jgi:hypothetical protein